MKKHLLVFIFCFFGISSLHAKADIYLATGVLTDKKDTDEARDLLEEDLKASNPEIYSSEPFKSAYNTSRGFWDFIEGASQLFEQNGWSKYWLSFLSDADKALADYYIDYFTGLSSTHSNDLTEQISNYKKSINAGNQVIVIAHSQGNFFTNEAYDTLSECQKKSFYMLGTANPADHVSGMSDGRGALATLDNDPITFVPSSMSQNIINSDKFIIEGYSFKLPTYHYFDYYRYSNVVTQDKIASFPEYAMNYFNTVYPPVERKEYPIDIQLSWQSSDIQLQLSSELGQKERRVGCAADSRYYVESIDDVAEGTYGIYVNHSGKVDEENLPQSVRLAVKTPNDALTIDVDISTSDLLDLGHIADIEVKANSMISVLANEDVNRSGLQLITSHFKNIIPIGSDSTDEVVSSSGGGQHQTVGVGGCWVSDQLSYEEGLEICYPEASTGDGGVVTNQTENNSDDHDSLVFDVKSKLNTANMGPIGGANVSIIDVTNGAILHETSTTLGSSLGSTGVILLSQEILNTLEDDRYYLVNVMGGVDVDTDDDGVIDIRPTVKTGDLHGLYKGSFLKTSHFKINILTEIAYQVTKELFANDNDSSIISSRLDEVAKKLLISSSDEIGYTDLINWMPRYDKRMLRKSYSEYYEPVAQKIYHGQDIYADAYKIVYESILLQYVVSVGEDSILRDFGLKLDVGLPEGEARFSLSGDGSELFEINSTGFVGFKDGAAIDFERQKVYDLTLCVNSQEYTSESKFMVVVENVLDAPEAESVEVVVDDNISAGSLVAFLKMGTPGDAPISKVVLDDNTTFRIDLDGMVYLRDGVELNYFSKNLYQLSAIATNAHGSSLPINIAVKLKRTPTVDSLDLTLLDGLVGGTKIGRLKIKENGTQIATIALSGLGSEDFNITKEGALFVANDTLLNASEQAFYDLSIVVNGESLALLEIEVQDRIVATLDTVDNAVELAIDKNSSVAYVADNNYYGAAIVDFSQKDKLSFVGRTSGNYGRVSGIAINEAGSNLVVGSYKKMELFDTEPSVSPLYLDTYSIENYFNFIEILPLKNMVFVGTYDYIDILKIEDNGTLGSLYEVYTQNRRGVVVSSDEKYMFVSGNYENIDIYDIGDLSIINITSTILAPYDAKMTLSKDNRYLFVTGHTPEGQSLLKLYNLQDIMRPELISSLILPEPITTLSYGNNYLYLGGSQLHVVDVADVTALQLLGSIAVPGGIKDVALLGNTDQAIVASGNSGIHLVNVGGFEHQEKVPGILPFKATVEADASINTVVGQVEVVYSGSGITGFSLAGEGAEKFSIDSAGTVRTVSSLFSGPALYQLQINVSNTIGTREVNATISVHSVPVIADFKGSINSMSSAGTVVGSLDLGVDDANSIEAISLNGDGAEYFQVNKSGEITFSGGIELHHFSTPTFSLSVDASNRYGQSETATVIVNVSVLVSEIELFEDPQREITSIKFSEDGAYADIEMHKRYESLPQYVTRVNIQDFFALSTMSQESIEDATQVVEFPANIKELIFDEDNKSMYYGGGDSAGLIINDVNRNELASYNDSNYEDGESYFSINHMQLLSDNSSLLFGGDYLLGLLSISADRREIILGEKILRSPVTTFAQIPNSSFMLVGSKNILQVVDFTGLTAMQQ
ncbi:hypothetical protein [Sulfurimonas sp. HSL3-7]|uniref:hypothetical protein n=1 Tax=Sulfonitrofixus jiaomeiensis TaxID=3131938 RepID=UPI0031F983B1